MEIPSTRKAWSKMSVEEKREYRRNWELAPPGRRQKWQKAAAADPEYRARRALRQKILRAANPEKYNARARLSRLLDGGAKQSIYNKRYRLKHPVRCKAHESAKKSNQRASGHVAVSEVLAMLDNQKGLCAACFCEIKDKYTIDRIFPIAFGGTNAKENLQLLCRACNISKKRKPYATWLLDRHMKMGYKINKLSF